MIIGIEMDATALRAVRFSRFRPNRAPDETFEMPLAGTTEDDLTAAFAEVARQFRATTAVVAVAVPSSWCFFRTVSFPYRNATRIEATLKYSLEGRLPGSVEDYVVEPLCGIQPAGAGGSRLLAAAVPAERSARSLPPCARPGWTPP